LIAAGHAELYQQNYARALEYFRQVLDTRATPNFFLHWHWRIQAHLGMTAALVRSGDIVNARLEAARCLESAQATADPNLKALALEMNARVALADHNLPGSRRYIHNALAIVEEFDVPVAAWRVHAAACELSPNQEQAERHRAIARDTLLKIANSFDAHEPLRASLLSAAPVRPLFGPEMTRAGRAAQLTAAGGVMERSPATTPMRNASTYGGLGLLHHTAHLGL